MKLSVIIPVYNAERHLRECLDSVLSQTLRDMEAVCVDDGSTDGSMHILRSYALQDSRVKVFVQSNAGSGAARNLGIEMSQGDFVAFLDADDLYPDSRALEDLIDAAACQNADVCGGSLEELLPNGAVCSTFSGCAKALTFNERGVVDFRDYAYDYGYYRFVYRRTLLVNGGIRFPLNRRFQDPPFMVRALAAAGTFYALPRITYRYRVESHKVEWWANGARMAKGLLCGLADVALLSKTLGLPKLTDVLLYHACEQYGEVLLDDRLVRVCPDEAAALCRAVEAANVAALLQLPYSGRTPILFRRLKLAFRRRFDLAFRCCRFVTDAIRRGIPYAKGRFRGAS